MGNMWSRAHTYTCLRSHNKQAELQKVEQALARSSPLVFAGECRQLHEHLGKSRGERRGD